MCKCASMYVCRCASTVLLYVGIVVSCPSLDKPNNMSGIVETPKLIPVYLCSEPLTVAIYNSVT